MDSNLYHQLIGYIKNNEFSIDVTEDLKAKVVKYYKHYIIQNDLLYKSKNEKLFKVIKYSEVEPLLFMLHNHSLGKHLEMNKVIGKVKEKYYWP